MGLRDKRVALLQEKEEREERDANPDQQWEYKTLNLNFKASIAFESEFNKLGLKGWEFVAMANRDNVHKAIFKRRRAVMT